MSQFDKSAGDAVCESCSSPAGLESRPETGEPCSPAVGFPVDRQPSRPNRVRAPVDILGQLYNVRSMIAGAEAIVSLYLHVDDHGDAVVRLLDAAIVDLMDAINATDELIILNRGRT